MLANQDIKYVVCAHTSASVLSVRAKSEIVCTDTEEHFTIQSDSICVQHVDSVLYTRGQHSESNTESVLSVRAETNTCSFQKYCAVQSDFINSFHI